MPGTVPAGQAPYFYQRPADAGLGGGDTQDVAVGQGPAGLAGLARGLARIERALAEDGAEAIVLGCAGMAELAASLAREHDLPVIDGVAAAVKLAEALVALGHATSKRGAYARPLPKRFTGAFAGIGSG